MTRQEAFDKVWTHFVVNEEPPSVDNNMCRYRGKDGARCAFGVLLPDEWYRSTYEGAGANSVLQDLRARGRELFREEDTTFLVILQYAHDKYAKYVPVGYTFAKLVEDELRRVAWDYALSVPGE